MNNQPLKTYVCAVSVGTVWTEPQSVREIDEFGLVNPVQLNKWLEKLSFEPRLDLCDGDRVQTQLLYGEPVIVEDIRNGWAKIIAPWQLSKKDPRGYPGWVPLVQLCEFNNSSTQYAKITSSKAQLWTIDKKPLLVISLNTILPVIERDLEFTKVAVPNGEALLNNRDIEIANTIDSFQKGTGDDVVTSATNYLDLPYFWGGMSTYGYDCSGFSYNMLKLHGYFIPRDASHQAVEGVEVPIQDQNQWKKGDLLFFAYEEGKGRVHHVGIYFGDGQMIHSPNTGKSVEIIDLSNTIHEKELCAVRRYFEEKGVGK